jgi:putative mRNA 3-end processing factor
MADLITLRPEGLYCAAGDFYIDPWKPVARAVITHGHSDHARGGMACYHTSTPGLPILQWRLGTQNYVAHDYGDAFDLGSARVSLHAAGHVLGSAQVRVEVDGETWVVTGDYKRQADLSCAPFEVVQCDTLITEATFALPIYSWPDTAEVIAAMIAWRDECGARGDAAILFCYGLGKAQRVLAELYRQDQKSVFVHGATAPGVEIYRRAGVLMPETYLVSEQKEKRSYAGELVLAPPSTAGSTWLRRFGPAQHAFASGWMQLRGNRRRQNMDRGFVISDHADWRALLQTIHQSGAKRVLATHGNTDALVRTLQEQGLRAERLQTDFGAEE